MLSNGTWWWTTQRGLAFLSTHSPRWYKSTLLTDLQCQFLPPPTEAHTPLSHRLSSQFMSTLLEPIYLDNLSRLLSNYISGIGSWFWAIMQGTYPTSLLSLSSLLSASSMDHGTMMPISLPSFWGSCLRHSSILFPKSLTTKCLVHYTHCWYEIRWQVMIQVYGWHSQLIVHSPLHAL